MPPSDAAPDLLLTSQALAAHARFRHGFSTAVLPGGGPLDLGPARGRDPSEVEAAWRSALAPLGGALDQLVLLHQVHGAHVLVAEQASGPLAVLGEADAVVTTRPGLVLAVRVADCVPILLASERGVAAIHAGWRGIVAQIVPNAVAALCREAKVEPRAVTAVIGPHAGVRSYETGPDVLDALTATGLPRSLVAWTGPTGREHTDLGAAVTHQLRQAGVSAISSIGRCTISDPTLHSHRRDGPAAGRQAAMIALGG